MHKQLCFKKRCTPAIKLGVKKAVYPAIKSGTKKVVRNKNLTFYFGQNKSIIKIIKGGKMVMLFNLAIVKIDMEYFAPLTNPKAKHLKMKNMLDFIKIDSGRLGAVNFNNMIPVKPDNYEIINLKRKNLSVTAAKYQELLKDQLAWLNENKLKIIYKADNLYALYIAKLLPQSIAQRCCNFPLLEKKCLIYNKVKEK